MAFLPCAAYGGAEIEKCSEKRDNGYWRCDEWADDWYYKSWKWQPGKFFCHALIWIAKLIGKAYHWNAHKVHLVGKLPKLFVCALYVGLFSMANLFGKILRFDVLAPTIPTSPFGPAVAYGKYIDKRGDETNRPLIMCWAETGDPKTGSSGLRLRYEQLRHYSSPFHNVLPQFTTKAVNGEVSHRGPALAFLNNTFFLAWTAKEPGHRIQVMQSSDGGDTWSEKITLNASSQSGPALATFQDRVYLAWRTKPRDGSYLKIMSSADGIAWENEIQLMERAESGPALARLGTLLYIAWNDKDNCKLNVKGSKDAITFENKVTLEETTDARPALCEYGGHLYLAWREKGQDGLIKIMRSKYGAEWKTVSTGILPSPPFNAGMPGVTSADTGLIIAWSDPNLHIVGRR